MDVGSALATASLVVDRQVTLIGAWKAELVVDKSVAVKAKRAVFCELLIFQEGMAFFTEQREL